jgi:hypothetical protein
MEMARIFEVVYSHWQDASRHITIHGDMPDALNNPSSDKIVVQRHDGLMMDIRRESIISIEQKKPKPE